MIAPSLLALLIWVYLLGAHGRFWQAGPVLPVRMPATTPPVAIVVPARDEAAVIADTLRSLLAQDYAGPFRIILVDDNSADGTGEIARALDDSRLTVITGQPHPPGWSGKLWAVYQGVAAVADADLVLLTDADIVHAPAHLRTLVAQIEDHDLDLVSEMVELCCDSPAERALVPAFVFFFQLLYPFAWVNDPLKATAAAAGGTILLRRRALQRIGGIESIRGALIDDVALAAAVKMGGRICIGANTAGRVTPVSWPGLARPSTTGGAETDKDVGGRAKPGHDTVRTTAPVPAMFAPMGLAPMGRIWLGHATLARSVRPYPAVADIWRMISRTAYVQLRFSPLLLAATTLAMVLVWLVPPAAFLFGHGAAQAFGLIAWIMLALSYVPTLRRFRRSVLWAPFLPLIAGFYTAATVASALNHYRGHGVTWKGRAYQ